MLIILFLWISFVLCWFIYQWLVHRHKPSLFELAHSTIMFFLFWGGAGFAGALILYPVFLVLAVFSSVTNNPGPWGLALTVVSAGVFGTLLYDLRKSSLVAYGLLEMFVALFTVGIAFYTPNQPITARLIGWLGGIYIFVRGISNLGEGIPEELRDSWNARFTGWKWVSLERRLLWIVGKALFLAPSRGKEGRRERHQLRPGQVKVGLTGRAVNLCESGHRAEGAKCKRGRNGTSLRGLPQPFVL